MYKHSRLLGLTALILGWLVDFLFWKQPWGVNFPLFVVLCLAGGVLWLGIQRLKPARSSLLLLAPILFFAALSFIRLEPLTRLLAVALTLGALALLAITYLGGRWLAYNLADYLLRLLDLGRSMITLPLLFTRLPKAPAAENQANPKTPYRSQVWAVVRGLLITIPILAFFIALLSSADLIFAQKVNSAIDALHLEKLPEYIIRTVNILIAAYLLAGVFLHAAQRSRDSKLVGEDKPLTSPFLGFTESSIVLGSLILLFVLFVIVQFQYFFSGQANIKLDGFTYAEYARRGFGELIATAFFSLLLFLGLSVFAQRNTSLQKRVFSGLGVGLTALVGVMLVSAFQRLLLYETAYGFTRLRTYPHVFMVWLGILLAAVVALEILGRMRWFWSAALAAGVGFTLTLSLMNVDGFIARQNIARAAHGEELDTVYLTSLSFDAAPALVELYRSLSVSPQTQESVGAALACMAVSQTYREMEEFPPYLNTTAVPKFTPGPWQGFHLSRWWGERAVLGLADELRQYRVKGEFWTLWVVTPGGETIPCQGMGFD